jgi:hypothetical protein
MKYLALFALLLATAGCSAAVGVADDLNVIGHAVVDSTGHLITNVGQDINNVVNAVVPPPAP